MAGKRETEKGKRGGFEPGGCGGASFPVSRFPFSDSRGFTLLELLVVMTIIGILAAVAVPALRDAPQRAREAALREDLFTMRSTIDQFHGDKGYYPPDLQTLVTEGYIRKIPKDPMTNSADTWVVDFEQLDAAAADEPPPPPETGEEAALPAGPGVIDVHSGSEGKALDGTFYKDW